MITTANYLLVAYVEGEQYHFEYEDCCDVWQALEDFWHEDYDTRLNGTVHTPHFRVDVLAMENGRVLRRYETAFDAAHYHSFFDNGHTVNGTYTLDQFEKNLQAIRERLDVRDCVFRNQATSLFFYMWNSWCEEECREVFGKDDFWPHFWDKWCSINSQYGRFGAVEHFFAELSNDNRDKLVRRATELYDGSTEKYQ